MLLVFFLSFFSHLWHLLHLICKRQLFFLFFFSFIFLEWVSCFADRKLWKTTTQLQTWTLLVISAYGNCRNSVLLIIIIRQFLKVIKRSMFCAALFRKRPYAAKILRRKWLFIIHFRYLEFHFLTQTTWVHLTMSFTEMQLYGYERTALRIWIYPSVLM